ncbi:Crp/Fnr family transcriptional regulator [Treponema sp. OMZ 840]|uniref:Crp/Fnr family transcriptional regulator n=1 Tax=Treponema sp. OMZ 840 TaxID=244313 RepID=UPI003D8A5DF9
MDHPRFEDFFPPWKELADEHRQQLKEAAVLIGVPKKRILHNGNADCIGVLLIFEGQLRAYMTSAEGKEVSLFRLFKRDMCLLSASCMLADIQFEITVEAEKDTVLWLIPAEIYRSVMKMSVGLANYTNSLMASHFTEVMWLMEQIIFKSMDERLAAFLLNESDLENTDNLHITHEQIARHLGSAREVITRLLQYLQNEGAVELNRGCIRITNKNLLENRFKEKKPPQIK